MSNAALGVYQIATGPGATDPYELAAFGEVFVGVIVTAIPAGATFQVFLEMADTDGNWQPIAALPAQTAVGCQSVTVSPAAVTGAPLGGPARLRWTCTADGDVAFGGSVVGM